jgi:transposase
MTTAGTPACARCDALMRLVEELRAEIAILKARIAALEKDSRTSSKPPSSDFGKTPKAKPKPKKDGNERKRGAQPGHDPHWRDPFGDADVQYSEIFCTECPDCHGPVTRSKLPAKVIQQIDLPLPTEMISITGVRSHAGWCRKCKQVHYAPFDQAVARAGLAGPRLTALVGYLKGACHCSYTTIKRFLRDLFGVKISRGYLVKLVAKVSDSTAEAYKDLSDRLSDQTILNIDETGHKDYKTRMWTWCFRASLFTLFKIDPSRGSDVLLKTLGDEFNGLIGCDYFSAYRKYMKDTGVLVQFCLAHFLRDVRFLVEHPHSKNQAYGRRVLEKLRALFAVIHTREQFTKKAFVTALQNAGDELWAEVVHRVPATKEARNLADRFHKHGESYLRFITTPGLEPTNNLAEQAIRFVVIDRKITQGSRSDTGQRWLERIWTAIATCAQSGRSVFTFLYESITAFFQGDSPPKLIADST